jgi:hypothetical protein
MTVDLMFSSRPTFLPEDWPPPTWRRAVYTDEGLGERHGLQLESGRWLSVQPNGMYEDRESPGGPYEWFTLDEALNVVRVTPHLITYAIAVREP